MAGKSQTFFSQARSILSLPISLYRHSGSRCSTTRATIALKQALDLLLDRLLPLLDLHRVNPVLLANLVDRLHPLQAFQTHLYLELWAMNLALPALISRILSTGWQLKLSSEIRGPLY